MSRVIITKNNSSFFVCRVGSGCFGLVLSACTSMNRSNNRSVFLGLSSEANFTYRIRGPRPENIEHDANDFKSLKYFLSTVMRTAGVCCRYPPLCKNLPSHSLTSAGLLRPNLRRRRPISVATATYPSEQRHEKEKD